MVPAPTRHPVSLYLSDANVVWLSAEAGRLHKSRSLLLDELLSAAREEDFD